MRTCFSMEPATLDPRKNGDLITSSFLFMLHEGLTRLLPSGEVELALAETHAVSDDGLVHEFRLKEAYWSDGRPITAQNFERSWKSLLPPTFHAPFKQLFFPIQNAELASEGKASMDQVGIKALDERTLRIELRHPAPHFLSLVSFCTFFPMPSHLSPTAFPNSPDSYAGSGPFWFGHWERGKQIVLYKNPHYWDAHSVRLPRIQIQILNYPYLILDLFQKEKLDWVSPMLTSLPTSSLTKYEGKGCLSSYPIAGTVFIAYNSERFPFQNVNFRKSLSFSIDRRSVVGSVTQMGECPASRLIPPVLDPSAGPVSFDPVAARCRLGKALVELGISQMRDGDLCGIDAINRLLSSNLTFSFSNDSGKSHQVVAHALIRHWKGVLGLNIEPEPLSFREQMDRIGKGDFGMTLIFSAAHLNDPMNLLERFKHKHLDRNFPRYESPEFISLLDHANRTLDSKERNRLLQMAELHLLESCPISPIYHVNYPVLSRNSVDGVEITPIGSVHFNRARVDCCDAPPNEAAVI